MEQTIFENKIKPVLLWMGTIVSGVMAVAYIVVVFVLIEGFSMNLIVNTTLFSIITAVIGFCIMQMLKIQGQSFAKSIEENQKIIREYTRNKTKDKKAHSLKYYWFFSATADILTKVLTLTITSIGMVYIMIEGNKDYSLLLLAAVNLLMFAGFGLISLVKAYDFYNESYVPYMLEKIEEAKNEKLLELAKAQAAKDVELAEKEPNKQGNDLVHTDRGVDILESSLDSSTPCDNSESLVLDSRDSDNSILGRTIYASSCLATSFDNVNQKTVQ